METSNISQQNSSWAVRAKFLKTGSPTPTTMLLLTVTLSVLDMIIVQSEARWRPRHWFRKFTVRFRQIRKEGIKLPCFSESITKFIKFVSSFENRVSAATEKFCQLSSQLSTVLQTEYSIASKWLELFSGLMVGHISHMLLRNVVLAYTSHRTSGTMIGTNTSVVVDINILISLTMSVFSAILSWLSAWT